MDMGTLLTSSCGGRCNDCKDVETEGKPICMQVAIMEHRGIQAEEWVVKFSSRFREVFEIVGQPDRLAIESEMFRA